jgi:outer membrane protein assembly factor BamB
MRLAVALFFALTLSAASQDGFVLVNGGALRAGENLEAFEMLDHPVTNFEYKLFVEETRHAAPSFWTGGRIPNGMEKHPVVFVNRYDALDYVTWRSRREHRIYRLPTASEFQFAAGAGRGHPYPWGSEKPSPEKANYDAAGTRTFAQWREFLKPVKSYPANPLGLYDMSGNVWQIVESHGDPAIQQYVYRHEAAEPTGNSLAGGSWARSDYYLRTNVRGSASAGIRHPDIGFRVVREPAGMTHFQRQPRRVIAAPAGSGPAFLSWQFLPGDAADTAFHVYRTSRRDVAGVRITKEPVRTATNYIDKEPAKDRAYYRVRAVNAAGVEGPPSEWAAYEPSEKASGLIATFEPSVKSGGLVPVFGDLDGDGRFEAVIRLDNGIREMSRDPGVPVELEAFTSYGRSLWRRPLVWHDHCFGNANNVPVVVYDLDGDGKAEIVTRLQDGDQVYVAVLDGMTGRVRAKAPWTPMATDFDKSSTRVHMSIAYLDGKHPAIVTQTGLYENEILDAYDANLKKLWQFRSFGETNGSGSHRIEIADVDGDGRDEVFDGTTCLNPNGTVRWSIYREHPDIVEIKHILPGAPGAKGRQVFYAVESNVHAGAYLVDANTGKMIWKLNREDDPRWSHAHIGWASNIFAKSAGMEMLTNRDGHLAKDQVLFSADGKILMNPFPSGWRPVNWTGGEVRDLITTDGRKLGRFTGTGVDVVPGISPNEAGGSCQISADLAGDYRDEIVCIGTNAKGEPRVSIYTNTTPVNSREVARTGNREYQLWLARNMGGGYQSYFEWEP